MPRTAERKVAAQARVQVAEQQPSDQPPAETAPIVPASTATQTPTPNKETPEVILKCLIMLFELMQSSDITSLNATLQTILDEFVKTSVSSVNVEIKMTALKTMGKIYLHTFSTCRGVIITGFFRCDRPNVPHFIEIGLTYLKI